jgi:hypothetical protein
MRSTIVEVTVIGEITPEALTALSGAGVRTSTRTTVLEARVRDQSALYGLLEQLRDLGLELAGARIPVAGASGDVEVTVRGPVGSLLTSMLDGVRTARDANTVRLRTGADLPTVIALLTDATMPPHEPGTTEPEEGISP